MSTAIPLRHKLGLLALAASLIGAVTFSRAAVTLGSSDVQLGGFFSQGYLYSSENNYPAADRGGTWDFREMAFNVSTTVGAHLRVGAQLFAQRFGNVGEDRVVLDWAVADYNFSPQFGVRVGRLKYPKGLYGEALDLDVVRPFIFLPNVVYNPALRDFDASFDGGMVYGSFDAGRSSFDYKAFYGTMPMSPRQGVADFYNNSGLYARPAGVGGLAVDYVTGLQLVWNTPVSGLKFMWSYSYLAGLQTHGPFVAAPVLDLYSRFGRYRFNVVSAEYTTGNWVFAAEWQQTGGNIEYGAPPVVPVSPQGGSGWEGWYVSAARRLNDHFQLGAYYSNVDERFTSASGPSHYQHDSVACLRYDYNEHILFKVEAHLVDGTYQTFNTPRIPNPAKQDRTTVLAVKTTLSF
jgi:hypothetical protein